MLIVFNYLGTILRQAVLPVFVIRFRLKGPGSECEALSIFSFIITIANWSYNLGLFTGEKESLMTLFAKRLIFL